MTNDERIVAIKARLDACKSADGAYVLSPEDLDFVLTETGKWHVETCLEAIRDGVCL